jgi:LmbE family N-acetylglucosaminyl deacetylase
MKTTITGIFSLLWLWSIAQQAKTSAEIFHQMQSLPVCGSVLYVAAHPDDENTRLISYLTKELHLRTAYLSLTRGDGGQNLIGNEQAEALGLIRTHELLQARKIDGGEQYFSRAFDFGFSKNPDETFKFWDKEKVLADAVWVIRQFQPDVIICRFPTTGEGGHGHHTASAIIAEEAFKAAADANRFPEQLQFVSTWQAKRLLWNTFNFGGKNTTANDQFQIDIGGFNNLLGKSYGEIAAESRSCHSSQAFGTAKSRNSQKEFFKTILGEAPKQSLTDGIDISFNRFGSAQLQSLANELVAKFDFTHPAASLPYLIQLYDAIENDKTITGNWRNYKLNEVKSLLLLCSGVYMEAVCGRQFTALNDTLKINLNVVNRGNSKVILRNFFSSGTSVLRDSILPIKETVSSTSVLLVNGNSELSQPYWLLQNRTDGMFVVNNQKLIGSAMNEPASAVTVRLNIAGKDIDFSLPVLFKKVEPSKGEVYQPLYITPPATVNFSHEVYIAATNKKEVNLKVRALAKNVSGDVELLLPDSWISDKKQQHFSFTNEGDEAIFTFQLQSKQLAIADSVLVLSAMLKVNGVSYTKSFTEIKYEHIPYCILLNECVAKLVAVAAKTTASKVGYIAGAGDKVPTVLPELNVQVNELNTSDLVKTDLRKFDAIVIGVRAFNTDERLKNVHALLMNYVQAGGTLLVQYNTNQNLVTTEIGPYPFKISRERVTDESSAVVLLNPKDSLLNFPNKITEKDFRGWIQERGLYFPEEVDSRYKKLLSMHDEGEKPLENSIIYCRFGKGKFVYTGLSFFRELPAGVPGAIRLFANLISKY